LVIQFGFSNVLASFGVKYARTSHQGIRY